MRRVLVIEDNIDSAETLREILQLDEHLVDVAYDGAEGIAKAIALRPDIVLCDISLPRVDGYGVARALRAEPTLKATYLVALSGYTTAEDVERSLRAGFDRHLAKPPSLEQIEALVARVQA